MTSTSPSSFAEGHARPPYRSLAARLLRRTILGVVLVTLLAAALQAFFTLSDTRATFERSMESIAKTSVPLLSVSLWDIEPAAVRRQLEQIVSAPEVAFAHLEERSGHVFEVGVPSRRDTAGAYLLDVPYPEGRPGVLATLEVSMDRQALLRRVSERVALVVAGDALVGLVICLLIAATLRMELEAPMRRLAEFTGELTPDALTMPLRIDRPAREWQDEIDLVANGFRTLQDAISAHVVNLDRQVAERTADLQKALEEIRALTVVDALTGCYNRRFLDDRLAEEVQRCRRTGHALSVIESDVDHFKLINDSLGHEAGDAVLRAVAELYRTELRDGIDWVARYGGDEFVIVLPATGLQAALGVAQRMREAIEAARLPRAFDRPVTASFGVARWIPGDEPAALLRRADEMLYEAKAAGRNRVMPQVG